MPNRSFAESEAQDSAVVDGFIGNLPSLAMKDPTLDDYHLLSKVVDASAMARRDPLAPRRDVRSCFNDYITGVEMPVESRVDTITKLSRILNHRMLVMLSPKIHPQTGIQSPGSLPITNADGLTVACGGTGHSLISRKSRGKPLALPNPPRPPTPGPPRPSPVGPRPSVPTPPPSPRNSTTSVSQGPISIVAPRGEPIVFPYPAPPPSPGPRRPGPVNPRPDVPTPPPSPRRAVSIWGLADMLSLGNFALQSLHLSQCASRISQMDHDASTTRPGRKVEAVEWHRKSTVDPSDDRISKIDIAASKVSRHPTDDMSSLFQRGQGERTMHMRASGKQGSSGVRSYVYTMARPGGRRIFLSPIGRNNEVGVKAKTNFPVQSNADSSTVDHPGPLGSDSCLIGLSRL
ncbi:hypothetical protein GGS20DRAFT_583765 [Poronia punctata]|nr:hypothetical protein GGS20DRAFT_583765 [Poronia punctata]